ncbi:MAG: HlyD family efflux transporter periplasmic adaptor subunit [Burkholderiaceae bacterium]
MRPLTLLVGLAVLGACTPSDTPPSLGTLERPRHDLTVESAEAIIAIEVAPGDRVRAGQVVLRLDPARARTRLDQARAQHALAMAQLDELRAGAREQTIRQARARLASARSAANTARLEFERDSKLVRSSYASQSQVDIAQGRLDEAQARVREADAALDELLAGARPELIAQAQSRVDAAAASIAELEIALARLTVVAPVDGRIDTLPYELGERPVPGSPVASMLGTQRVYARVYVPAASRATLQPGSSARVVLAGSEQTFDARLHWISAEPSFTPFYALTEHDRGRLAYLAEFDLTDAGARDLPVGQPVEVRLD